MKLKNIFSWGITIVVALFTFYVFDDLTTPACFAYQVMPKGCYMEWIIKFGELLLLLAIVFYAGLESSDGDEYD